MIMIIVSSEGSYGHILQSGARTDSTTWELLSNAISPAWPRGGEWARLGVGPSNVGLSNPAATEAGEPQPGWGGLRAGGGRETSKCSWLPHPFPSPLTPSRAGVDSQRRAGVLGSDLTERWGGDGGECISTRGVSWASSLVSNIGPTIP